MTRIRAAEAPVFSLPGVEFRGLTAPSRGAREICTWRLRVSPHYPAGEAHSLSHEEIFIGLGGQLVVRINGDAEILMPGDAIAVPAGAQLPIANPASSAAYALVCIAAGFTAVMADGQVIGAPPWAQ